VNNETKLSASSPAQDYVEDLHREFTKNTEGKVATYIPNLAKVDPNGFGIGAFFSPAAE
jgi:glutaminase